MEQEEKGASVRGRRRVSAPETVEEDSRPRILRREVTREEVLEAVPGSYGLASELASRLGCTIGAVNAVLDERYGDVEKALEDEADRQEDLIVKGIIDDAKAGDAKARELFLKTLARRHQTGGGRGGSPSGGITVKFDMPEPPSVTPDTKASSIGAWAQEAKEFHRAQEERAKGADLETLIADARSLRPIPQGSGGGF